MLKSRSIGAEISVSEKRNTVSEDAEDEDEVDYEIPTTKGTLTSAIRGRSYEGTRVQGRRRDKRSKMTMIEVFLLIRTRGRL